VVVALLVALAVFCMLLVAAAWRRGGRRIGLWTLGFVLLGLALGLAGAVIALAEAICHFNCPPTAKDAIALSLSVLSFVCATAITARAGGRSQR
jgi:membrane-associated PAP2 superfamily phosphatase